MKHTPYRIFLLTWLGERRDGQGTFVRCRVWWVRKALTSISPRKSSGSSAGSTALGWVDPEWQVGEALCLIQWLSRVRTEAVIHVSIRQPGTKQTLISVPSFPIPHPFSLLCFQLVSKAFSLLVEWHWISPMPSKVDSLPPYGFYLPEKGPNYM